MSNSTKDRAISITASQLRLSQSEVRNVVNEYEKNRSSVNRENRKKSEAAAPTPLGGGWYQLPDGTKVQGKKAAGIE